MWQTVQPEEPGGSVQVRVIFKGASSDATPTAVVQLSAVSSCSTSPWSTRTMPSSTGPCRACSRFSLPQPWTLDGKSLPRLVAVLMRAPLNRAGLGTLAWVSRLSSSDRAAAPVPRGAALPGPELRAYSAPAPGWSQGPGFARGALLRVDSTSVPGATISGLMRPCEGPWLEKQAMESMSGPLHWDGT